MKESRPSRRMAGAQKFSRKSRGMISSRPGELGKAARRWASGPSFHTRLLIFIRVHHSLQTQPQQRGGGRELFPARGGRHAFPRRSRRIPLIAVAGHARDVEEAPRCTETVSLTHGRGASI